MTITNEKVEDTTGTEDLLVKEVPDEKINDLRIEGRPKKYLQKKITDRALIKNVNNQVLIDFLSPEISENESAKRKHKLLLIILLASFLILQFTAVVLISIHVIEYATSDTADYKIVKSLLSFVSAYITSVVVELIAILYYIVQNVFDTSIAELVKIFKDSPNKEQEN